VATTHTGRPVRLPDAAELRSALETLHAARDAFERIHIDLYPVPDTNARELPPVSFEYVGRLHALTAGARLQMSVLADCVASIEKATLFLSDSAREGERDA